LGVNAFVVDVREVTEFFRDIRPENHIVYITLPKAETESRALAALAFHFNLPIHHFYQSFGNGETQACAFNMTISLIVYLIIIRKKAFNIFFGYALA